MLKLKEIKCAEWQSLNVEYEPHATSGVIFLFHTFKNYLVFFSH